MKSLKNPLSLARTFCTIAVVAILTISATSCGQPGAADENSAIKITETAGEVTRVAALELNLNSQYPSRRFYTGRVEPARRSDLGFELGGLLKSVLIDEGDTIGKGDELASLDTDRLDAQKKEAQAGVAQADAQLKLARSTLDRLVEAREFDGVSQQQLDEASNAAATTEAALQAAKSRLNRVKVDVAKAQLLAPYDAVVLQRYYDEGQVLAPGQAVLTVQDTANLQVRIGVAGSATNQLNVGSIYSVIINRRPVRVTLRSIIPVRDAVARTVDALFVIDSPSSQGTETVAVKAGDLAQLELRRTVDAEGYWVPLAALAEGQRGLWNVYVLVRQASTERRATHVIESRTVEVLYQDGSRAFVNGAIGPGDYIVPSGLNRVVPGQRVNFQREGS